MKTVLVNRPIHPDALAILAHEARVLEPYTASEAEILELLPEVEGIVLLMGITMTEAVLERCLKLKVIGRHGAGVDIVDLNAAAKRGIIVTYTPFGPTESTAEHAFLLMMAAARRLPLLDSATRKGNFKIREQIVGRDLKDKKVGIIGFGRIGRRLAEMCRGAFDMPIYVYDPMVDAASVEAFGATYMPDLIEMARQVDFISLHCPLTPQTRHIVGTAVLGAMKPDAYLINASRGPTVDEAALVKALKENRIAGAGLDVFEAEPPAPDNPLFSLENVVLTPHLASFTDEGRRRMGVTAAQDVLRVLRGEEPKYPVPA